MGGRGAQGKQDSCRGSQLIGSQRSAEATEIKFVVPERAGGKDLGTEWDALHGIAVTISAGRIPVQDVKSAVLAATQQQVGEGTPGRQVGEQCGAAGAEVLITGVIRRLISRREI